MPSVGFEGALGQQAMAAQIRQRIIDALEQKKTEHAMSAEDQRLAIEKQRFDQEAQDRALLRSQQGQVFNESVAEKTAANLTPQSIISPELAARFKNTSLAPLIAPDQTLPSASIAGGASMPGAAEPSAVAPTITHNAPTLTGQLRYAGTPTQVKTAADEAGLSQLATDKTTPPAIRGFLQMRQLLPKGENIPYQLITEPNGPSQPLEQVATPTGPKYVPRPQAVGATPYHVPPQPQQPIVIQTATGPQLVNRGAGTASPITQAWTGAPVQAPVPQAIQVKDADKKSGLDALSQLDQSIIEATPFIGPGAGRVSTVEQMIGNPDPKLQALGTKMLLTKMKIDAAIGGARAAASPQILARWDSLLTQKLTPEALHATVQAIREIIGGGAAAPSGPPAPLNAAELMKKYGG